MGGRPRVEHRIFGGIEYKHCSMCKDWFPVESFGNQQKSWDKLNSNCKKCDSVRCKEYKSNLSEAAKEKRRKRIVAYEIANKEKILKQKLLYRRNNPEKVQKWRKKYKTAHPEKAREYNNRRRSTPKGHLSNNISKSMYKALKGNKAGRHWEDLVGYTLKQLHARLRRTLPSGYTWQDYLDGKLHIDHKVPVSVFNFEKPEDEDFQRCFALKNLQLLPALENIKKSDNLDRHFQPLFKF